MTTLEQIIIHSQKLPESLQNEALDFITFLEAKYLSHLTQIDSDSQKMKGDVIFSLLEEGATFNLFSQLNDPIEWQEEIRKDRILFGR